MKNKLLITVVLAIAVFLGAVSLTFATSFDSFNEFNICGISMAPSTFTTGAPSVYTVTLNTEAYLYFNGEAYEITSIFGFYAVGQDFQATGESFEFDGNEWKWVGNGNNDGAFAGWNNNDKKSEITPGTSRTFSFDSMTVDNPPPVMGLHIIVDLDGRVSPFGGGNTGYVIPIPEPSGILALLVGISASVGLMKRKKR